MKNTSKKLLLSVFVLLFAVVAVATTSFAWFTISGKARVSEFDLNITTGEGIQIQAQGIGTGAGETGWLNVITNADIVNALGFNYNTIELAHVTSTDVKTFREIVEDTENVGKYKESANILDVDGLNSGIFTLRLNFRANTAYFIRLTSDSYVTSGLGGDGTITLAPAWSSGQTYKVNPAHAVRVGFDKTLTAATDVTPNKIWEPYVDDDLGGYGFVNPTTTADHASETPDTIPDIAANDGAFEFFNDYMNAVNGNSIDYANAAYEEFLTNTTGTQTTFNVEDSADLIRLTDQGIAGVVDGTDYTYYGSITVRIWLEGWDADCFNAIFATSFHNLLAFEGFEAATITPDVGRVAGYMQTPAA